LADAEGSAQSERISVVDGQVVHRVLALVGVVVTSQQTIDLSVDEQVVMQATHAGLRHARWTTYVPATGQH